MHSALSSQIAISEGVWLSLTHYPRGTKQSAHSHDFDQISFLVAGALQETLDGRTYELHCSSVGHKPAGALHEDHWGPEGTLVFSINIAPDAGIAASGLAHCAWTRLPPRFPLAAIIACCFSGGSEMMRSEAIEDALALLSWREPALSRTPQWLEQAHRMLGAEPDLPVSAAAQAARVDRTYFTRAFQHYYGIAPSIHRRRAIASRAVAAIARSEKRFGEVAHAAGFSDQSHMNRVVREQVGLVPGDLRRLLSNDLTSIQDAAPPRR
jgi:AraC-like DNA-binding protein